MKQMAITIDEAMEMIETLSQQFGNRTLAYDGVTNEIIVTCDEEGRPPLEIANIPTNIVHARMNRGRARAAKVRATKAEMKRGRYHGRDCIVISEVE